MCRVAFRSCVFTHGVVGGNGICYLLSVCAHLPSHQRNSHGVDSDTVNRVFRASVCVCVRVVVSVATIEINVKLFRE